MFELEPRDLRWSFKTNTTYIFHIPLTRWPFLWPVVNLYHIPLLTPSLGQPEYSIYVYYRSTIMLTTTIFLPTIVMFINLKNFLNNRCGLASTSHLAGRLLANVSQVFELLFKVTTVCSPLARATILHLSPLVLHWLTLTGWAGLSVWCERKRISSFQMHRRVPLFPQQVSRTSPFQRHRYVQSLKVWTLRYNRESIIDCSNLTMTSFPSTLPIVKDTKRLINTEKVNGVLSCNHLEFWLLSSEGAWALNLKSAHKITWEFFLFCHYIFRSF